MNKIWEESEKTFIRNNADLMKDMEIAHKLSQITGRSVSIQAVRKQRQKMGITKERGRGRCAVINPNKGKTSDIGRAVDNVEKT